MKKVDLLGAAHDDVADARQDEGVDAAGDAVFFTMIFLSWLWMPQRKMDSAS